ncbi:MAG: hypothetical protein AB7E10_01160 [Burkholderiaceae bacterium]
MNTPTPSSRACSPATAAMPVLVYLDDAAHAQQHMAQLAAGAPASHWILVACAPRITHRISKWVSHSSRENWRKRWADKLFAQMRPWLQERGARATTVLATGPLEELTQALQAEWGALHIVDARRPKLEATFTPDAAASGALRSFLLGFGVLLALQAD